MSANFYGLNVTPEQMAHNMSHLNNLTNFRHVDRHNMAPTADYLIACKPEPATKLVLFDMNTGKMLPKDKQKELPMIYWRYNSGQGLLEDDAISLGEWIMQESAPNNTDGFLHMTRSLADRCHDLPGGKLHGADTNRVLDREWFHGLGKWIVQSGGFFVT